MYNFGEAVREMTPLIMTGLAFALRLVPDCLISVAKDSFL